MSHLPFMASLEDAAEAPFCSICRRSSDLKWRKHVFSKGHQRAAADFLAVRVAAFEVTRAKVAAQSDDHSKLYCVFCEADIESLRLWVQHSASPSHRKHLNDFCIHHRCDAAQQVRQQLCISTKDADTLIQMIDTQERQREAATKETESSDQAATAPSSAFSSSSHIEAFMNTVAARLQDARSNRAHSANLLRETSLVPAHHRHLSAASRSNRDAGIPIGSGSFAHRTTETARGSGLGSIRRVDWGEQIANVHSFAVPPWMVDTEEEYKRANQRPSQSAQGTKRKQPPSGQDGDGSDIFARLKPKYDETTWLPNFGGVWQEGPRSKTRKDFSKSQTHEPPRRQTSLLTAPPPQRETSVKIPAPLLEREVNDGSASVAGVTPVCSSTSDVAEASPPLSQPPPSHDLDAKKSLLLAQKERLRAKLAAKRNAPSTS